MIPVAQASRTPWPEAVQEDTPSKLRPAERYEIISRQLDRSTEPVTHERLFLDNLTLIESTVARVAWRRRLTTDEADDFRSHVFLKLVEDDYLVLRRFEHRSSLPTYLAVVIQRLFQDYRNHLWGKWRPSAEARRGGPVAEHLDRLITRDGLSFDEAFATLQSSSELQASREELYALASRFPQRRSRRAESDSVLANVPADGAAADDRVAQATLRERAVRARAAIDGALRALSDEDQVLVRLCFWDRMSVADAARSFGVPQKPLYRRIERVLKALRASLVAAGVADEARELLDQMWSDLLVEDSSHRVEEMPFGRETDPPQPSIGSEVTRARG